MSVTPTAQTAVSAAVQQRQQARVGLAVLPSRNAPRFMQIVPDFQDVLRFECTVGLKAGSNGGV